MEISNIIISKESKVDYDSVDYITCIMITLNSVEKDGTPEFFDIQFLSLADLEYLHRFVDNLIKGEEEIKV